MSTANAEFHFAAELVSLAVAAAGLLLVGLRGRSTGSAQRAGAASTGVVPAPVTGRVALGAGFVAAGAAAVVAGTQLGAGPGGGPGEGLGATRIAAAALLAAGTLGWGSARRSAWCLRLGAAILAAAGVAGTSMAAGAATSGATPSTATVDGLLVGSAVATTVALVALSRVSVAAQVAAASAGTLIAIVLVASVALASITTDSVQRSELQALGGATRTTAAAIAALSDTAAMDARFAAVDLSGYFAATRPDPLLSGRSGAAALAARLAQLQALYPVGGFAYVDASGEVLATAGDIDATIAGDLADRAGVITSGCDAGSGGVSAAVARAVFAAASSPECLTGTGTRLGTVLRAVPVDAPFLRPHRPTGPTGAVAVLTTAGLAAVAGSPADIPAVDPTSGSRVSGGRLVAVQPLPGAGGADVATLVASTPATVGDSTLQSLLRTLYLVALGGTLLALALAAMIGDRVTAGVRRLTAAAQRVQAGDTATRAGVGGADEVGALGGAFDAMVVSIEEHAVALRQAADDEGRLRDRLEAIVAGMGDALVALDGGGRVTDFNPAAEALTGVAAADALGRPAAALLDLRTDDGAPLLARLLDPSGGGGRVVAVGELEVSGSTVPVGVTSGVLLGPLGVADGTVVVLRDLRSERQVERMKTEFLSRVGHELRTPLTGILGYAELLDRYGEELPADRASQWHGEILTSAKRLVRTVEMLEFFAGSGAGRVVLRPEAVDAAALVAQVAASWEGRVPPGTTVAGRASRRSLPVVADRRWLALAVDELVDNAVKFSPAGGRIDLRAATTVDRRWVELAVRDRGKGMTAEERSQAFNDFAQGDSSDTRAYGGLGLGLALVQRVVEELGGGVTCRSTPGRGSTFTIRLPAVAGG